MTSHLQKQGGYKNNSHLSGTFAKTAKCDL